MTPRARPVVDLPLDALLARAAELAKRWAIALLVSRPLDRLGELPFEQLSGEAPALCAQAIRALQSDVELDRLTGGGAPTGREATAPARRLAALAGAHEVGDAVAAVEALRGVLWEAMLEELGSGRLDGASSALGGAPARRLADLGDRLACVCAGVVAAAVTALYGERDGEDHPASGSGGAEVPVAARGRGERSGRDFAPSAGGAVVIVDERAEAAGSSSDRVAVTPDRAPAPGGRHERPLSWDESPPMPPRARADEIEIRDERRDQGAAAWTRSIGRQLERFAQDGLPFGVLLVEFLDIERGHDDELGSAASPFTSAVEDALAAELQAAGSVTQERPGRYWVLASQTDRAGAEHLCERLAAAAQAVTRRRGYPLEVAIGTAVCPDDGREAAALAAHADVGLYAARSAARATGGRPAASLDEPSA
jgi:GGDEF domain-containing protein